MDQWNELDSAHIIPDNDTDKGIWVLSTEPCEASFHGEYSASTRASGSYPLNSMYGAESFRN